MVEQLNAIARLWWGWSAAMFWQVGLLILVIATIDRLIRRWAWPQLRYALWSLILVKLLLPPSLSLPSGIVPGLAPVVEQALVRLESRKPPATKSRALFSLNEDLLSVRRVPAGAPRSTGILPVSSMGVPPMNLTDLHGQDARATHGRDAHATETPYGVTTNGLLSPAAEALPSLSIAWQVYIMAASLAGTLILGIWLFVRLHSFVGRNAQAAAAASLPQSFYNQLAGCAGRLELRCIPRVVVTKRLATPAVFGMFRPVLLMPRGYLSKLSRRDTEHMLLHELAHIKRGDLVAHGLYMLLQVVYWYNPLLWLVRRQMHHLRELSCDATVAELLRERTPAYRQTLLETARRLLTSSVEPGLGLLGLFEDSNRLLVRLNWLTKPTWRYRTMKRVTVATIAALMLACVLPMARAQEAASNEVRHAATQEDVQLSQQMAELEKQLDQLRAQQEQLQSRLRTLAEKRSQVTTERRPAEGMGEPAGRPHRERAPEAIGEPVMPPEAVPHVRAGGGGRPGSREERMRAEVEAEVRKAWEAVQQARAEAERRRELTHQQHAWPEQTRGWEQGEQMQKWQKEMEQWQQQMQEWARAHRPADGRQSPPPPMPAMPPMPAPAHDEPLNLPGGDRTVEVQLPERVSLIDLLDLVGKYTGLSYIYDPEHVRHEVTVKIQGRLTGTMRVKDLYGLLEAALGEHGLAMVRRDGNVVAIVPKVSVSRMPAIPAPAPTPAPFEGMGPGGEVHVPQVHVPPIKVPHIEMPHIQTPAVPEHVEGLEEAVVSRSLTLDPLAGEGVLEVTSQMGSIAVRSGEGPGYRVVATIKGRAETLEKARQIAERAELVSTPSPTGIRVSVTIPDDLIPRGRHGCAVELEVIAPRSARLKLSQAMGDIRLTGLNGHIDAFAQMGSILARDVAGQVSLKTNMGEIDFIGPEGLSAKVQAKTNFGSVQTDLPLEMVKSPHPGMGSTASGVIGDGQGNISLTTNMGSIRIRTQAGESHQTF